MIKAKATVPTFGENGDGNFMGLVNHASLVEEDAPSRTMEKLGHFIINCDSVCAIGASIQMYTCALG